MTARLPRRFASTIRLLAFVLFALALLVRPMVDSVSELHEFTHGGHGNIERSIGGGQSPSASKASTAEGKQASTLHSLLNFAHCCGTTMAALPATAFQQLSELHADAPTHVPQAAHRVTRLINPFRPPITT
ncbi:MAG: hypothetical protein EPO46_00970 [Lysobacter sp.]|nr:MAG: hypothetical protein EPO46_00970 [Lysobacter sp.]